MEQKAFAIMVLYPNFLKKLAFHTQGGRFRKARAGNSSPTAAHDSLSLKAISDSGVWCIESRNLRPL